MALAHQGLLHMLGFRLLYSLLVWGLIAFSSGEVRAEVSKTVVSLAPSLTEIVFALGKGDSLLGVSRFCDFPDEARKLTKVGGLHDPNIEQVIKLKPDIVLALEEHNTLKQKLSGFGIRFVTVRHDTLANVLNSITLIAKELAAESQGEALLSRLKLDFKAVAEKAKKLKRNPTALIVLGASQIEKIDSFYVAGSGTFYDQLLTLAGARNLYNGLPEYGKISTETVYSLNPDLIIELMPNLNKKQQLARLQSWNKHDKLNAVRNARVRVFVEDFAVIPGPRLGETLKMFEKVVSAANK